MSSMVAVTSQVVCRGNHMGLVSVRVGNQLGNHSFPCFCLFVLQHLPWHGALDTEIFIAPASQAVGDTSLTRYAHNKHCSLFIVSQSILLYLHFEYRPTCIYFSLLQATPLNFIRNGCIFPSYQ